MGLLTLRPCFTTGLPLIEISYKTIKTIDNDFESCILKLKRTQKNCSNQFVAAEQSFSGLQALRPRFTTGLPLIQDFIYCLTFRKT